MSAAADSGTAISNQKKLLKLTHKRLERFVTLLPKVLVSDAPETVHDLRVWSRRLQQALRVILPAPKPPKSKKVIRTLRQVRRVLGPLRNLDVNIGLIMEKRGHAGAAAIKRAWESVQNELEERRAPLLDRARRDIGQHDVFAFIERAKALIETADRDSDPGEKLDEAAAKSMKAWEEVLTMAYEQRDQTRLHEFRIATKRLRYRAELLADQGQNSTKPLVEHLKQLQTALGDWHDRCVLMRHVAEFIGRPDFLANHPDMGRILLAEMEKEKLRNDTAIDDLFDGAAKVRESWGNRKPVRDEAVEKSER